MEDPKTLRMVMPIAVAHTNGYHIIAPDEIIRIETASSKASRENQPVNNGFGCYTFVYLSNNTSLCVRKQICDWMELLASSRPNLQNGCFFKPHQSHIINLAYVTNIITTDGYQLRLKNSCITIPVARNKIMELKKEFGLA